MKINKDYLTKFKVTKEFEFQATAVEMQKHFKQNIWFLFYRYPLQKIKDGYEVCKSKEIYTIPFIIGVINKLH